MLGVAQEAAVPWSYSLRRLAERFGERPAVTDQYGGRLSYAELDARAHAFAARLRAEGLVDGAPIGVLLPNCVDAVWVSYGIRLAGAAETPLNWTATGDEIAWAASIAKFRMVLTRENRADLIRPHGLEAVLPESVPPQAGDREVLPPVPGRLAGRLLFTSGTTGRPKGVVYSHGRRWIGEQLLKATLPFVPQPGDRILLVTPFPHGASLLTYAWCDHGGEVLLMDGVDPDRLLPPLERSEVQAIFAPPTVLAKLATAWGERRFEGVRCVFTGTQPLGAPLYAQACRMFGPVIRITYGKTECVNPITVLAPAEAHEYFSQDPVPPGACVGWPAPGVELRIQDGEVWLRAWQMSDHLLGPDGPIDHAEGGWHPTGDLGHFDERGRLVLVGRVGDVIKTGGYRVNPDEVEIGLAGLSRCAAVSVVGLPSGYWGEVIAAVAEGAQPGWEVEVQERVAALSRYKRPRLHVALDAMPRNAQGKIRRKAVIQAVLERFELLDGPYPELVPRRSPGAD
jgi:acyl-CoA synthetase (AMP-forming)/AMP-acid ligase II